MRILHSFIALVFIAAVWPFTGRAQTSAAALFQEALTLERAEGKLKDAIFRYERVVAEFPSDRDVAPRALFQLAAAYEKLGNPRARLLLSRLVDQYPSAMPYAATARKKLATQTTPAGPFPAQTMDAEAEVGSPDGKLVVYRRDNRNSGRLYARNLATGVERVIVDLDGFVGPCVFSPDSRRLAFGFQNPAQQINETRIVTLETGESRTLAVRGQMLVAWTTKGDLVLERVSFATSSADTLLVSADSGGEPRKVLTVALNENSAGPPIITPDGSAIVVQKSKQLTVIDVATGTERAATLGSGEETRPIVSADSRLLAFASNRDGRWASYVVPLDRIPVREPLRIGPIDEVGLGGSRTGGHTDWWASDGLLTMVLNHTESNVYRISMDPATGRATDAPERLTQDAARNHNPALAPDGKHIAYYYRTGTKAGIAVMDAKGVTERPLVEQSGNTPLFWRSPDEILFYDFATPAGQRPAITSLNITTGAQRPVAQVGLSWVYVPARQEILHLPSSLRPGTVLKAVSIADGTERTVATIDYLGPWLAVSPDGKHIAYHVYPDRNTTGACELSLMGIDGSFEKRLVPLQTNCGGPTAWSPNGRYLMLTTTAGPRVLDLGTLQSWPLHSDFENQAGWRPGNWGPDGSFVVASRQTSRVERLAWKGVTYDVVTRLLGRK